MMAFLCQDFLGLPSARTAKVRGGRAGLTRQVSWFHALESVEEVKFLQADELVFFTGISIGEDPARLLALFDGLVEERAAGIVVNVGKYIRQIPEALIARADAAQVVLFELPWEVKLGDVTQELGRSILLESAQEKDLTGLVKKCLFSDEEKIEGYDLSLLYDKGLEEQKQVLVLEIPDLPASAAKQREHIERSLARVLRAARLPVLDVWNGNELIFLLPGGRADAELAARLRQRLREEAGHDGYLGLGGAYQEVVDLRRSLKEARFALRLARAPGKAHAASYASAGAFRLIHCVERSVLQMFSDEMLVALLVYDEKNRADFTETLEVYLEENEDTAATLARLYIHRNTLAYRLHRIEEITGKSMDDAEVRLDFRLAFKIRTYLAL